MLVRWFVIVLTLIGAVPVRFCTCGAAHLHSAPDSPCESDREPPAEYPTCAPEPAGPHHDADCHAVKPRPLMSLGLLGDAPDVTASAAIVVTITELPPMKAVAGLAVAAAHPPPNRPLYLTLGNLRN